MNSASVVGNKEGEQVCTGTFQFIALVVNFRDVELVFTFGNFWVSSRLVTIWQFDPHVRSVQSPSVNPYFLWTLCCWLKQNVWSSRVRFTGGEKVERQSHCMGREGCSSHPVSASFLPSLKRGLLMQHALWIYTQTVMKRCRSWSWSQFKRESLELPLAETSASIYTFFWSSSQFSLTYRH